MNDFLPSQAGHRFFPKVTQFLREYSGSDPDDRRSALNFREIEAAEALASLRNELRMISTGNFNEQVIDQIVGRDRKLRYGSYQEWAKLILVWLAASSR